jgi:hypothetical protein
MQPCLDLINNPDDDARSSTDEQESGSPVNKSTHESLYRVPIAASLPSVSNIAGVGSLASSLSTSNLSVRRKPVMHSVSRLTRLPATPTHVSTPFMRRRAMNGPVNLPPKQV